MRAAQESWRTVNWWRIAAISAQCRIGVLVATASYNPAHGQALGQLSINPYALDLAEVLGTSPRLWMNLQSTYDLAEATRRRSTA